MDKKLSRRNVLGGLTAAGSLAAASCTKKSDVVGDKKLDLAAANPLSVARTVNIPANRLNIVCHGMMLFLWNKTDPDYITILIPTPPMDMSTGTAREMHLVSLGGLKGTPNLLPQPPKPASYLLQVPSYNGHTYPQTESAFRGGARPGETVVLKSPLDGKYLVPQGAQRYTIRIPFPTDVRRFDVYDYLGASTYNPGKTVTDLQVHPRYLAGVHVLTYERVKGQVTLKDTSSGGIINLADISPSGQTIHLYSQPAVPGDRPVTDADRKHHIYVFNQLAKYYDVSGNQVQLDLDAVDVLSNSVPEGLPLDLSDEDLKALWEFPPVQGPDSGRPKGADPVECLQGWGT